MCDVMTALSVGMTALGQISESKAASNAAKANAQIAENNRILSERQSKDAIERGRAEETDFRRQLAGMKGTQRAAFGASGVSLSSGSPTDILTDTAVLGELDALTIRQNAQREAYGYNVQASNFQTEANVNRTAARNARSALPLQLATTVVGGASRYYQNNPIRTQSKPLPWLKGAK